MAHGTPSIRQSGQATIPGGSGYECGAQEGSPVKHYVNPDLGRKRLSALSTRGLRLYFDSLCKSGSELAPSAGWGPTRPTEAV